MGHRTLALALAMTLVSGCAGLRWQLAKPFRAPGESLAAFPEKVWEEYDCGSQKRPFFMIEKNELMPHTVRPGGDFGHRLVYILCPEQPTGVVSGSLATQIRFRGVPLVVQTDGSYEIKPGRWVVDARIRLPESAEPGVYAYELAFEGGDVQFDKSLTFVVEAR